MIYIIRTVEKINVVSNQHFQNAEVHDYLSKEQEFDVLKNPNDYKVVDGKIKKIYNEIKI